MNNQEIEILIDNKSHLIFYTDDLKDLNIRLDSINFSVYENKTFASLTDYKYIVIFQK